MQMAIEIVGACWAVLGQMAPYLLFGFLMAGVLSIFISPAWVERHLGGRGLGPVLKATILGVPLPLCSCSVIPVTVSMRNHGASRGAALGFLLSAPQTGVDSILATYALLGPVLAVFRPFVALVTGILGGGLTLLFEGGNGAEHEDKPAQCADECCSGDARRPAMLRALHYGFVTLPKDIAKALLIGIVIAGLISIFVEQDYLAAYLGGGLLAMLVMMAIGIPIYVCSTASIPIAVGFMHLGASPGAALVFLIAGPATNAAAISVVWKTLGRRTAIIYLASTAICALAAGAFLDLMQAPLAQAGLSMTAHGEAHGAGWFSHASAVVLLVVLVGSLISGRVKKSDASESATSPGETAGDKVTLRIDGMTCGHCADAVARALRTMSGVTDVRVDLDAGQAVVSGEGLDGQALAAAVVAAGYESTVEE
jgi:uncharacterized protein